MIHLGKSLVVVALALVGITGCGREDATPSAGGPDVTKTSYVLESEPAGAKDVIAARESAKSDEEVTVIGRIGGSESPWVDGVAAFTIVDTSLKPCNEKDDDSCPVPWDYCCDMDKLPQSKAMVKVVNAEGQTVQSDARELLGVKELATVVVHGKAKRDDAGNLTVLADGVFVRQ